MNPSFSPLSAPASRGHTRARRGSALLLAVAIVVLMSLMGAAYLQVARTDRRTSIDVDTRANVDTSSILAFIGQILAEDVPSAPGAPAPEPYDFPWTNPAAPAAGEQLIVPDRFAPVTVPGPQPDFGSANNNQAARPPRATADLPDANGGDLFAQSGGGDDLWLASTEPDFGSGTWPHLSNLLGVFLDLRPGSLTPDTDGNGMFPAQYLSTADNNLFSGNVGLDLGDMQTDLTGQAMNANLGSRFADASGDGIADSRWTWAPLSSDAGLAFVMAVRIIDNSALVNLNAWTDPDTGSSNDSARWNWPGELQLEEALALVRAEAGTGVLNAADVMQDASARDMAGTSGAQRYENWLTTTSTRGGQAGNLDGYEDIGSFLEREGTVPGEETFGALTREDRQLATRIEETELRWKNGLNRTDDNLTATGPTPLEGLDNALFRSGAVELDAASTPFTSTRAFFEEEPRKQLTTISGSSNAGRVNLNTASPAVIADVFQQPLRFNGGTPRVPALFDALGWTDYFTVGAAADQFDEAANAFGNQLAAVVMDFQDDDSEFTLLNNAYGMERVPVISEVYAHGRYVASNVTAVPGPPAAETVDFTLEDVGVVVELVNPWAVPTVVSGIELMVDGESWGALDVLLGTNVMDGHEIAVLRRPDAEMTAVGPSQAPILSAGIGIDREKAAAPDDYPIDATTLTLGAEVQLMANDSEGDQLAYQTVQVYSFAPTETAVTFAPGSVANGDNAYVFTRVVGTANGLNALAVRSVDFLREVAEVDTGLTPPVTTIFVPAADLPPTQFGDARKNVVSTASGISGDLGDLDDRVADAGDLGLAADPGDEPWTIGDVRLLTRAGDILQMVFMGPRPTLTGVEGIAESWMRARFENGNTTDALRLTDLMIDLAESDVDNFVANDADGPESFNFATAWLNRFAVDRETGSGLVPGRINLNTVTERVLSAALPISNAGVRDQIAARIVAARNNPASVGGANATTARTGQIGLAAIGELAGDDAVFRNVASNNALLEDFNEAQVGLARAAPGADGHSSDREERDRLISYLHQVASTRSDIFTAYILVRAYPVTDFSVAPVDEFRLLAVFDRTNAGGANPRARVIAVERLDDN